MLNASGNGLWKCSSVSDAGCCEGSDFKRKLVELYATCHTKMEEIVPNGAAVRLVAFNLDYLPGGDKKIKTQSDTTSLALEAARRILARGGLISVVANVGHSGGRDEFEKVQSFAAEMPVDDWICCKLQTLNQPLARVLVLLSTRGVNTLFNSSFILSGFVLYQEPVLAGN